MSLLTTCLGVAASSSPFTYSDEDYDVAEGTAELADVNEAELFCDAIEDSPIHVEDPMW